MLILSVSAPRAGSSWYYHLTAALLMAAGGKDAAEIKQQHAWIFPGATDNLNIGILYGEKLLRLSLLSQVVGNFAVKSHGKPSRALRILSRAGLIRSSFIYRDPRDRLVSIMNIAEKQRAGGRQKGSFAEVDGFAGALEQVRTSYQHFAMWQANPQTLLMRYEDLVQNTEAEMQRTAAFFGLQLSAESIAAIVAADKASKGNAKQHFVRGQIAYYKEALSPLEIEEANAVLQHDILKLGYRLD